MTTIICEMDSMELCVWKEKHLQRACSGDEWIFREKEKEPEGIRVNFDVTHAYEIFSCLGRYISHMQMRYSAVWAGIGAISILARTAKPWDGWQKDGKKNMD